MKGATAFSWSGPEAKLEKVIFFSLILFLPVQLGKHFWPPFSIIQGLRIDYLSPTIYLTDVLFLLLLALRLYQSLKSKAMYNSRIIIWLTVMAGLGLSVVLSSRQPLLALYGLLKWAEILLFASCTAFFLQQKNVKRSVGILLSTGMIFEALLGMTQYLRHGSIGGVFYWLGERMFTAQTPGIANASISGELILRPYGTFPHPNVLAAYLVIALVYLFFSWPQFSSQRIKIWLGFGILTGSICLLLTLSRSAIMLYLSVVFYFLYSRRKKISRAFFLLPGFLAIFIIFFLPFTLGRFSAFSLVEPAFKERIALFWSAWEIFKTHPLWGVGFTNFLPSLAQQAPLFPTRFLLQPVHNVFALLLTESGIVFGGVIIFLGGKLFFHLLRRRLELEVWLAIGFLILGSTDHFFLTLQQGQLMLGLILGMMLSRVYNFIDLPKYKK